MPRAAATTGKVSRKAAGPIGGAPCERPLLPVPDTGIDDRRRRPDGGKQKTPAAILTIEGRTSNYFYRNEIMFPS